MRPALSRPVKTVVLVGMLWVMGVSMGRSAAPPGAPPGAPPAAPAAAPAVPPQGEGAAGEKDKSLREQSIYIPYEKLRKVFEKEGRGVFLPYEKFRELWDAAQARRETAAEPKPPVGALITEIDNEATASKDVVRVRAVMKIEVLGEGWNEVPLRLADTAITEATLGGQPARILSAGAAGYKLLVEKKGKGPETLELVLQYAKAVARAPGQNSVAFEAPQAPVNRWKVRIPEAGVKVNLHPLIAATEVVATAPQPKPEPPPATPAEKKPESAEKKPEPTAPKPGEKKPEPASAKPAENPQETVVLAFVGAAPTVRIEWTPKAEGAAGLEALATVQAEQQVSIHEGGTRTRTLLAYTISRAELRQVSVEVPADQKVVNVFDANVRQWSVEQAGAVQKITVQLFEAARQSQNVIVELEKYAREGKQPDLAVPVVRAVGVGRQQGVVVVQIAEGIRAEVVRSGGLLQLDAAELPPALAKGAWAFSYRYATVPYDLQLSIEKVQARILVDSLVEAELLPERLSMDLLAIYTVERAGVFRLELDVPAGFEVRQVRGRKAAGAEEAQVESHHLEGKDKTRLIVNLGRKAFGKVGLEVQLHKELHEPDLLSPTGTPAKIPLPLPAVAAETAERASGRLIVWAPESLQVNHDKTDAFRSVSIKEAMEGMEPARPQKAPGCRAVLSFVYTQKPGSLPLTAERRKPQVTVRQFLLAQVKEGEIEYRATFFYSVLYSGVKSLRIDLPAELAPEVQNLSRATLRHETIQPAPAKLDNGYVAWSFTGESELLGDGKIELTWKRNIGQLAVESSVPVPVPWLKPRLVDQAWGQIVVAKAETIDVQDDPKQQKGLRGIDPQRDLMPGASAPGAARAWEFHDGEDWQLALLATRYRLEEIKHTSIERGLVRLVVTGSEKVIVQALYRLRSAEQRLVIRLPAEAKIDVQPQVNGKSVTLEVGQQGEFYLPLVNVGSDDKEPALLELRYGHPMPPGGRRLEYPHFPQDPAVQKVYLAVYLPEGTALLGHGGPWTEEYDWRLDSWGHWRPLSRPSDTELAAWISEGLKPGIKQDPFPTHGRMYVFSALRPAAPDESSADDGALAVRRMDQTALRGLVFGAILAAGLVLLAACVRTRGFAAGTLVAVLILCGVFLPTLARQVLNGTLAAALAIVVLVWLGWYFARTRPRSRVPCGPAAAAAVAGAAPPGSSPFSPPAASAAPSDQEEGGPSHA